MVSLLVLLLAAAAPLAAQQQNFDVHALLRIARIADPQISPDGRLVAFTVQTIDLENNRKPRHIYVVPLSGGAPKRITDTGNLNDRPRWSPDSKQIAFISDRSGSAQLWLIRPDGAGARQVTNLVTEAGGVLYSPDGKNLVFTSDVYPDCPDEACNKQKLEAEKNSKVKARTYASLLYRHWDHWQGKRRSHLFVVPIEGGTPKDLTPGDRDAPPFSLGGADDYAVSPDGQEVCFVMNADPEPAVSTNSDLYVVPIAGGEARKITVSPGADNSPAYSPDGKYLAFRSQVRAGYESDRWRLAALERATGKLIDLSEYLDRWVNSFTWAPDSTRLFFTVEDRGQQIVQMASATGGGARTIISGSSTVDDVRLAPDGKTMIYTEHSGSRPVEIVKAASGGSAEPLTHLNDALLASYQLPALEEFWVESADKAQIHSFLLKPPGFSEDKKYPALFLIHGGPQSAFGEKWSYRWNAQVFAAAGYVVVMPNFRGSTSYGQKFTDDINADWGGKPFDDIMAVADHVAKLAYVDPEKMAAAGGSYGGYMADWLLGHTQRFKALVSHAGVFDLRSMFGETEELWFPLWDLRGAPWDNAELYARLSPSFFAKEFRTPTLVIHGELDYRVPYGQGLQLFTALQLQKVPSKLLLFPDEGHWVLKPQNTVLWYTTFLEWIAEWVNRPPAPPAPVTVTPGPATVQAPVRTP
jgi:dipeptidyl aminopeptidase/acylaminoacyl peptidase